MVSKHCCTLHNISSSQWGILCQCALSFVNGIYVVTLETPPGGYKVVHRAT